MTTLFSFVVERKNDMAILTDQSFYFGQVENYKICNVNYFVTL